MRVFALVQYEPYDGGYLQGVYSSRGGAEEAARTLDAKPLNSPGHYGSAYAVHEVEVDGEPQYRTPLSVDQPPVET